MTGICLSGGAEGADLFFGDCARAAGHRVIHWSFRGARSAASPTERVDLTEDRLLAADPFLRKANETLGRSLPMRKPWIMNLLRRNFYQIEEAEAVYAVSTFDGGQVKGGTAWAVQMFLDKHNNMACPCFVYDQSRRSWYSWSAKERDHLSDLLMLDSAAWHRIDAPPPLVSVYAGIGSRHLTEDGRCAVASLYLSA